MAGSKIAAILCNEQYRTYMTYIEEREQTRLYCKHGWRHSLDVARVAYILALEAGQQRFFAKEVIYAAGLLHDIGRWQQYDAELTQQEIDHAQAGAALAAEILRQVGFREPEISLVQEAIAQHRHNQELSKLGQLLYMADKAVRPCLNCSSRITCKKVAEMDKLQIQEGLIY